MRLELGEKEAQTRLGSNPQATTRQSPQSLPLYPTSFIGRKAEQRFIHELQKNTCQLLSLIGSGGIGKTRLALALAQNLDSEFPDGAYFVPLSAVSSAELMVFSMGDTLGPSFRGQRQEQLLDYLCDKKMLVILDNLEHLLAGTPLISDILKTAPDIKLIATSRERLNLQSEYVFDLYGLQLPDEQANLEASDALKLFAERTSHARLEIATRHRTCSMNYRPRFPKALFKKPFKREST